MSERRVDAEIVRKQFTNDSSLIDEDEIIDVSGFVFDDRDSWLYLPKQYEGECKIDDLYTWLKNESGLSVPANKKFVDTRTFTRPKKRSNRTNFESVFDSPPSVPNVWKVQGSNFANMEEPNRYQSLPFGNNEAVPHMLKTPSSIPATILNETVTTSGQESMEVFLNMSQSKGIDSFINLSEPGISDALMNISQPSVFYSSITSLPREESLHNTDCEDDEKSTNLTRSILTDRSDGIINLYDISETFPNSNISSCNSSYSINPANLTFINNKSGILKATELNATYDAEAASRTLKLSSTGASNTTCLSSTFVTKDDSNINSTQSQMKEETDTITLDATYLSKKCEKDPTALDSTYCTVDSEKKDRDKTHVHSKHVNMNSTISVNPVEDHPPFANSTFVAASTPLDSTFKMPIPLCNQSTPKNAEVLNSTYKTIQRHLDHPRLYNAVLSANFKAPTSLRRELLAEIQRSGERKLDSTYDHISNKYCSEKDRKESVEKVCDENIERDIPVQNKYNTYKKESPSELIKNQIDRINETEACAQKNSQDRKYYTFTKKSVAHEDGKTDIENTESLEEVDATFIKPFPKLQNSKQHKPRFSKLPQFLQKSNPNLLSNSLKTAGVGGPTNTTGMRYTKGSQPNIVRDVEKSLTKRFYSLGKMKSGSEQRLLELNTNSVDFQTIGAGGSTESIESTQSAHSAPDLDDRLSTCSDCSHNSYTTQTMNIEQLHQIVRMQEESLKQDSTPKLNRRVLENTWIDGKKDLPSPILKNGIDSCGSDSSSPLNFDGTVKTSSPILSPTGSSQSINIDSNPVETVLKDDNEVAAMKKNEVSNKPAAKIENRRMLRQPTNWNTGNKTSNTTSAIPRPTSRIPAPRFARPKTAQGDVKRG